MDVDYCCGLFDMNQVTFETMSSELCVLGECYYSMQYLLFIF